MKKVFLLASVILSAGIIFSGCTRSENTVSKTPLGSVENAAITEVTMKETSEKDKKVVKSASEKTSQPANLQPSPAAVSKETAIAAVAKPISKPSSSTSTANTKTTSSKTTPNKATVPKAPKTSKTVTAPAASTSAKSTNVTAESKPTAATPVKVSGIDWNLTNKIRSYKSFTNRFYANGKYKADFDQYLLDIVNNKTTAAQVEKNIKSMSGWIEKSVFPGIDGEVQYITDFNGSFYYGTVSSASNDPEMLASIARDYYNRLAGEYAQVIVVYDANTKKNIVHSMTVKFIYSVPLK